MRINKNLGHLMVDLETMGNKAGCAIVSIGAVEFDLNTGEIGRTFYERVDLQSCLNVGLFVNGRTIYWWMQQNEEARKELCRPSDNLKNVLEKLKSFMGCLGDFKIWGNGARFDIAILEAAFDKCGYPYMPWKHYDEMDVRTLVAFAPSIKNDMSREGVFHNAVDDCLHQIKYCTATWNSIHKPEEKIIETS